MSANSNKFDNAGFMSSGFFNLTPREAYDFCKKKNTILLDVRDKYLAGYRKFTCPKVMNIPLRELKGQLNKIPREKPVIVADSTGLRSHEAMELLINNGFTNVANLAGGLVEWERDQLPVNVNTKLRLTGSCMCQLRPRENK